MGSDFLGRQSPGSVSRELRTSSGNKTNRFAILLCLSVEPWLSASDADASEPDSALFESLSLCTELARPLALLLASDDPVSSSASSESLLPLAWVFLRSVFLPLRLGFVPASTCDCESLSAASLLDEPTDGVAALAGLTGSGVDFARLEGFAGGVTAFLFFVVACVDLGCVEFSCEGWGGDEGPSFSRSLSPTLSLLLNFLAIGTRLCLRLAENEGRTRKSSQHWPNIPKLVRE